MVVAFTGHRAYVERDGCRLSSVIRQLISEGTHTFLCGMAEGFDIIAAEAVIALKREFEGVKLVCVVPYKGHKRSMPSSDWTCRYEAVLAAADGVVTLAEKYKPEAYMVRNDYLCDNADVIVCYYSCKRRSGTGYTVTRALKNRKRVINIYANGEQIRFFG